MKNFLASIVLLAFFTVSVSAQSIYVRAGTGYGLPIASAIIGSKYFYTSSATVNSYSEESVKGSYGSGGNFNLTFGYELNKNIIIEFNTQYILSKKFNTINNYTYDYTGYSYVSNHNTTSSAKGLFFNPSVIFSAGFGKAAPYARFGFIFGSPKVRGAESSYDNGDGVDSTETKWEYSKGLAFGFQGAVGMNWKLSEKLDLFTELNFISMTYFAGEYNLTKYNRNGYDYLEGMSLSQTQTIYKRKYTYSNSNYDPAKPTVSLRESTPFSSLTLQIGVRFYLWTKPE